MEINTKLVGNEVIWTQVQMYKLNSIGVSQGTPPQDNDWDISKIELS